MPELSEFESVTPDLWLANEQEWKEKLLKLPNWYQIPLINSNASHNLADNSLVRFRGMIQDMHNPEFYFEKFQIYNTVTNEVKMKSGKYRDTADILENEKINYTENLVSADRQSMVVISLPGLSDWAQKMENSKNHLEHLEQHPCTTKRLANTNLKRSYEETEDDPMEEQKETVVKEQKTADTAISNGAVSREHLLNFPLPDISSKSCIIKLYEENNDLKVNDMIEVVGFLSVDPMLSGEFNTEEKDSEMCGLETPAETITHNPPPSLVPRLHVVHLKKLEHCNPLIDSSFDQDVVLKEANAARQHLLTALTELLLGDNLAAEYLICHLIAHVYSRNEAMSLGQFCLNLSNLPTKSHPNYGKQLYDIIKQFVTKSYYMPLTIDNLNTSALLPKKDYECNRLTSGVLQLSKNTHLVLDETKLEEGRLDSSGLANVVALRNLIENQNVEYDFKYYKMDFEADIPVLILSEGKSMLPVVRQADSTQATPQVLHRRIKDKGLEKNNTMGSAFLEPEQLQDDTSDYHVPLRPEAASIQIFDAIVEAATYYLKEDIMNTIRMYLTNLKFVEYKITEDVQFVNDDFVEMRKKSNEENSVTADDLHRLLVLARCVSLSRGFDTLNKECWDVTKGMEEERLFRVKNRVATAL